MGAQGNKTSWCTKRARSIVILPNPSFHWRCNHLSGASQSKAANVNTWLLEAHLFNFFLLYVHSWLKPQLAASLCSCWACSWSPVIKSRHCPWKVPLADWCWELISDLVVTGGSLPAAHVEALWIQHLSSGLVLLCRCWNGEGKMGRARGSSYSAANNVAMVMLMRVS